MTAEIEAERCTGDCDERRQDDPGEVFGAIRPANTLLQVTGLVDGGPLVEIEADAVIQR